MWWWTRPTGWPTWASCPQVEWILRNVKRGHQTLLFSATLDGAVDSLIRRYQHDPTMHSVAPREITVAEMVHRFVGVHKLDKVKVAAAISSSVGRTLMFTRTKVAADRLARDLRRENVNAAPIHGDLRQAAREKSLRQFIAGELPVLVATDVAARGSTSTMWMWSCSSTRPPTTRPTFTVPAAPPGRASPVWW